MSRITLIHWNATEAKERAALLKKAGHEVELPRQRSAAGMRALRDDPPDAFVIDLDRQPSGGRDVALWLRQQKATRYVPIVFVGGEPQKVARVRKILPDAVYTEWKRIRGAVRKAVANPPVDPVVQGALAGYAGTPLPKKLGIKSGLVVALLGAPPDFEEQLGNLPADVHLRRQARGRANVILLFVKSRAELARRFQVAARALVMGGRLWICWPKRTSGIASDLTQQVVREYGLARSFVDYKICAVDQTWSGLCFTQRR